MPAEDLAHGCAERWDTMAAMPKAAPAKTPKKKPAARKRFSLVPHTAQQQMFTAIQALEETHTGAEVAVIAATAALGENDCMIVGDGPDGARQVTVAAVQSLIGNPKGSVLARLGAISAHAEVEYRRAFAFAVRHKLPIIYLVANTLTPGRRQQPDLRTLPAELGLPFFSIDGADAIAAYRVTTEALHHARSGRGPSLVEALAIDGAELPLELLRGYMERHGGAPVE